MGPVLLSATAAERWGHLCINLRHEHVPKLQPDQVIPMAPKCYRDGDPDTAPGSSPGQDNTMASSSTAGYSPQGLTILKSTVQALLIVQIPFCSSYSSIVPPLTWSS